MTPNTDRGLAGPTGAASKSVAQGAAEVCSIGRRVARRPTRTGPAMESRRAQRVGARQERVPPPDTSSKGFGLRPRRQVAPSAARYRRWQKSGTQYLGERGRKALPAPSSTDGLGIRHGRSSGATRERRPAWHRFPSLASHSAPVQPFCHICAPMHRRYYQPSRPAGIQRAHAHGTCRLRDLQNSRSHHDDTWYRAI